MSLDAYIRGLIRDEVRAAVAEAVSGAATKSLVTLQAYAASRSISVSTVRAAIRAGTLQATKIGRAVRVSAGAEIGVAPVDEDRAARVLGLVGGAK